MIKTAASRKGRGVFFDWTLATPRSLGDPHGFYLLSIKLSSRERKLIGDMCSYNSR